MAQFRDTWPALAPEWLTTGFAEKYMYTLELQRDILLDKMNQAIKIRWPGQGDASQLPYLAHDRQIFQGPNEPVDQFIQRLIASLRRVGDCAGHGSRCWSSCRRTFSGPTRTGRRRCLRPRSSEARIPR